MTDKKNVKIVVGGRPKEVFEDSVSLIKLEDLEKDVDGTYTYSLPMDKQLGLRLRGNTGTGYKWQHKIDTANAQKCFELTQSKYSMDEEGYPSPGSMQLMGVGGTRTMVFKPLIPSCTNTVFLSYAQPWSFAGFDKLSVSQL